MGSADLLVPYRAPTAGHIRSAKSAPQLPFKSQYQPKPKRRSNSLLSSVLSRTVHGVGDIWLSWQDGLTTEERRICRSREERKRTLRTRMKTAESFKQWEAAAHELDALDGNELWKQDESAGDYKPQLIRARLRELDEARASGDVRLMMHLIRTALSRDLGGMGNVDLYRHCYIGTKDLIERYVRSALETIDAVVAHACQDGSSHLQHFTHLQSSVTHKDLLDSMLSSRQSFGRSALLLSGGGTLGMTHVGVLKALFQADLLPRIISGASAGSIVCSVMCTRTDDELPELLRQFPYGDLSVFESEENKDGVLDHLRRLLTEGSWSDISHLTRVMRGLMGDITFQEAYNRTRRVLNVCVSTASVYEMPRLLNYVTAPNIMIWSAVAASCSVPLVFTSSPLLIKDPATGEHRSWNTTPQQYIDGSVDNDLPMTRLAEMFNVNHFIVSQVNPHVIPFLTHDDRVSPDDEQSRPKKLRQRDELDWTQTLTSLARDEALHRLHFMAEMGIFPNLVTKLRSVLSQKYSGDITILPEISLSDLSRLLKNPTTDFMLRTCLQGERATWPKLSRIRDRCAIELQLDRAVHRLRARVVLSGTHSDAIKQNGSAASLRLRFPRPSTPGISGSVAAQSRHRRLSGGSMWTATSAHTELGVLVDDADEADGEGSETPTRLHRASKSQTHVSLRHAAVVGSSVADRRQKVQLEAFKASCELSRGLVGNGEGDETPMMQPGMVQASQGTITSPTEDIETSEQDRWSETGGEQVSDESDPDSGYDMEAKPAIIPETGDKFESGGSFQTAQRDPS